MKIILKYKNSFVQKGLFLIFKVKLFNQCLYKKINTLL